jgi:hypothetical protein
MAGTIINPSTDPSWLRANGPKLALLVASLTAILGLASVAPQLTGLAGKSTQLGNLATYVKVTPPTNDAGVIDGPAVVTVSSTVQLGTAGPTWSTGVAIPTQSAPVGSLYSRLAVDGGAAVLYLMDNAGWTAVK